MGFPRPLPAVLIGFWVLSAAFGPRSAGAALLSAPSSAAEAIAAARRTHNLSEAAPARTRDGSASTFALEATFLGCGLGNLYGSAVAGVGDVNADGFADVLIGEAHGLGGEPAPGMAYLHLGAAGGAPAEPADTAGGTEPGGQFGYAVAAAGDVNGDGFADALVGAPGSTDGTTPGRVFWLVGGPGAPFEWLELPLTGAVPGDRFGAAVAGVGDLNGDGFADVMVGAPAAAVDGIGAAGRAFLYLGGPGGPQPEPVWMAQGRGAGAQLGYALAGVGDVNGDGRPDALIGAPWASGSSYRDGRVDLYLGSATGLASRPAWSVTGGRSNAAFGAALAPAGDIDRDGFPDLLIGAPEHAGTALGQGRAMLFRGTAQGFGSRPAWTVRGEARDDDLGRGLAGVGDLDGDGFPDLAIGVPGQFFGPTGPHQGAVRVYRGGPTGPASEPAWTAEGWPAPSAMGYSVAAAGDTDGDGQPELLVGAPLGEHTHARQGVAQVFRARPRPFGADAAWVGTGAARSYEYGYAVAGAGDVDGDGYADVLVGQRYVLHPDGQYAGRAVLHRGSPAGTIDTPAWERWGNASFDGFGEALAGAGDVNGDGYADVVIGAPFDSQTAYEAGRAEVFLGGAAGLGPEAFWYGFGSTVRGWYGRRVAGAGDVNGDGYADLLVSAYEETAPDSGQGRAYLYLGSPYGPTPATQPDWVGTGEVRSATYGAGLAGAGDVNGDGYADVIVGAPFLSTSVAQIGRVYVYHGSSAGLSAAPNWIASGDRPSACLGLAVAGAGDVNGDGFGDVVVASGNYADPFPQEGHARLYLGSPDGLAPGPAWTAESDMRFSYFGGAIAAPGDVDGDGYADVLIGVPYFERDFWQQGAAFLYHGQAQGLAAGPRWRYLGISDYLDLGWSLAAAGDVDGDGWPDLIVGAPSSNHYSYPGLAFVLLGACGADADSDGLPDCRDRCPDDAAKVTAGACGCGRSDADTDTNGLADCVERCLPDGDLDHDGRLTAFDAQRAFGVAMGFETPPYVVRCSADCTGDGGVTAADAQTIFAAVLGQGRCAAPAGGWR